ncbi:MAG: hypothetical protein VKO39_12660 [Cyanobacteriota bacterium]|nr:hypothetical protein [Cyanobacteriota bacterium]
MGILGQVARIIEALLQAAVGRAASALLAEGAAVLVELIGRDAAHDQGNGSLPATGLSLRLSEGPVGDREGGAGHGAEFEVSVTLIMESPEGNPPYALILLVDWFSTPLAGGSTGGGGSHHSRRGGEREPAAPIPETPCAIRPFACQGAMAAAGLDWLRRTTA